jgi:adenylate kinase
MPLWDQVRTVFLGPPGVGKGTQAVRFAAQRHLAHIATGDMFRAAIGEGSEVGKKAKSFMTSGNLVPDEIVNELVEWRLQKPDAEAGFVLDGYPRTTNQAEALDRVLAARGHKLDAVILFDVAEDTLVERASSRVVCRGCGTPYNTRSAPPKIAGVCDRCGQPLYRRDDDRPEIIRERIRVYREQTEPLIALYERHSILRKVPADRPIEALAKELDKIFPKKADAAGHTPGVR